MIEVASSTKYFATFNESKKSGNARRLLTIEIKGYSKDSFVQ